MDIKLKALYLRAYTREITTVLFKASML